MGDFVYLGMGRKGERRGGETGTTRAPKSTDSIYIYDSNSRIQHHQTKFPSLRRKCKPYFIPPHPPNPTLAPQQKNTRRPTKRPKLKFCRSETKEGGGKYESRKKKQEA